MQNSGQARSVHLLTSERSDDMHRTEEACIETCVSCGAEVWPERDRGYFIGPDDVLCFECAVAKGGVFDEVQERWTVEPTLTGVAVKAS
jgi:hypothetical protein